MAKTKQAFIKDVSDLEDCKKGTEIHLFFDSGDEYAGIFQELNNDEIIIKAVDGDDRIGLPFDQLVSYWERIK